MKRLTCGLVFIAGLLSTQGLAMPGPVSGAIDPSLVQNVDFACGPGYHLGRGGQRCWSNVPGGPSFGPPQRGGFAPSYGCPPGFHLGRGGQRCWPN
jgi:hypothetical protein